MTTLEDLNTLRESLYSDERNAIGALEDARQKLHVWFGETREDEHNRSRETHNALAAILLQQQAQSLFPTSTGGALADIFNGIGPFGEGLGNLLEIQAPKSWWKRLLS